MRGEVRICTCTTRSLPFYVSRDAKDQCAIVILYNIFLYVSYVNSNVTRRALLSLSLCVCVCVCLCVCLYERVVVFLHVTTATKEDTSDWAHRGGPYGSCKAAPMIDD